ncbi:MAG: DNA translocase FtsK [Phycisphaerae bacterium]|nr:DNA translocase FtsK [Phycisphaerae bacterium]
MVLSAVLCALAAFVLVSLATFHVGDPPTHAVWPANSPTKNLCGPAGAWVAYQLVSSVGAGSWVVALLVATWAILETAGKRVSHAGLRAVGVVMLSAAVGGLQSLLLPRTGTIPDLAGGVVGQSAAVELGARFGPVGAGVWMLLLGVVGGIVTFDKWLFLAPAWIVGVGGPMAKRTASVVGATAAGAGRLGGGLLAGLPGTGRESGAPSPRMNDVDDDPVVAAERRGRKPRAEVVEPEASEERVESTEAEERRRSRRRKRTEEADAEPEAQVEPEAAEAPPGPEPQEAETAKDERDEIDEANGDEADETPGAPQVFDPDALRAKIAKLPIVFGHDTRQVATEADLRDLQGVADLPGYKFPGLDLLEAPEENFSSKLEEYVREQAEALEAALQQYRIDGEVAGIESGPVITLYHVRLAPGTKVAQIHAVSSDIARALKAVNIRIVPNMVGRDTIGIEVPNTTKEKVRLKELMSKSETFARMKLPMFLGKDASGEPLIADLTQMPHMLIAGTTGSGKSVCMNTIIISFLYTKKPNELKLVLVDPKMVEMSQFKDIPHLMCPVVTEMAKAAAILEWACGKMDERYELLAEAGCRDIAAYNDLPWEELRDRFNPKTPEEEARIPRRLPYMVFIIDELADLMMTNKEVEGSIIRIAQKARAVGIHLILATQRPQANVVTGLIKSNMPCRISFKVASGMDSRIVLDQKGGELLLGQGDMLYLSPRSSKLTRAQGTLVDDVEIRKVVRFMRDVAQPSFERQLLQIRKTTEDDERIIESENNSSASLAAAQEDPLFDRAVEIVLETKRGSVSLLQRRLAIGYTRASRLIDLMGIAGIISDHKGSVARDVAITIEEWEAMKKQAAADRAAAAQSPGGQQPLFAPAADEPAGAIAGDAAGEGAEGPEDTGPDVAARDAAEASEVVRTIDDAESQLAEDDFPDAFQDDDERRA